MNTGCLFGKLLGSGARVCVAGVGIGMGGWVHAGVIAYQVPYGTAGNQAFSGPLGMDFNVQGTILVTHLGVFDDGSNGLNRNITAYIYDRTATSTPIVSLSFPTTDPGQLIGGSRFKPLPSPVYLPFGFQGSVVAENYGAEERNGNSTTPVWTTDSGGGVLNFVGGGRFGTTQGAYPSSPDGGPANRYAAGTFIFERAPIAYDVKIGTIGNQTFTGALGMDFRTNRPLLITHLGAFDSGGDGISGSLAVKLYARTKNNTDGVLLTSLTFSSNSAPLIGGTRFLPLTTPLLLPGGFEGSIVMEVNPSNPNGNSATPTNWITYDGQGALSFVGGGRYTTNHLAYPTTVDGGPANPYAAGSFMFAPFDPYTQPGKAFPLGIAVPNPSFEFPSLSPGGWSNTVLGWTVTGSAGNFYPTTVQFPGGVPDGNQVAFINPETANILSTTLSETLQPNTLYILEVDWGRRTENPNALHSMSLRAGGIDLGWVNNSTIGNGPTPPAGEFRTARGYFTANHNAPVGSPLEIRLTASNGQTNYDRVRLWKLSGASIPLNNPSFEMDDVPGGGGYQVGTFGWVASGEGIYNPAGVFEDASEITPAEGSQSAFVKGGASLTQTLAGVPLRNDYLYILLVDVADRKSTTSAGYRVELLAGGQTLAMDDNSLGIIQATDTVGYFYTTAVVQFRGINHPLAGQDLGIRLSALGDATNQTYFDNVRLFAYWVPEPSSWSLLLLAGGILLAGGGRKIFPRRHE